MIKAMKLLLLVAVLLGADPAVIGRRSAEAAVAGGEERIVIAAMVIPGINEIEATIWARSIREFGGRFSAAPVWVLVPGRGKELSETVRKTLSELGVEIRMFEIDEKDLRFPLGAKASAAAEAERSAQGECEFLVWLDPDNMVIGEPEEFVLPAGVDLAYRPVHHIQVGSIYSVPPDRFWSLVYGDCDVPPERVFPMKPNVEDIDIRPYFNAGHLVVRPEIGLLRKWRENFLRYYRQPAYLDLYRSDFRFAVFVHQAILSATILAAMPRERMVEMSERYNYPLNLYSEIPERRRTGRLNDLVTARYDFFTNYQHWNALIRIEEPLKGWIREQFRPKGINVLVLLSEKFGANSFLNRDAFEQYGWNVTVAGMSDTVSGCDFFAANLEVPPVVADIEFDEIVNIDYFDALAIMPATSYYQGDPFSDVISSEKAIGVVRKAVIGDVPVSAVCSGARVLAAADLVRGKKILGQPPFREEYERAGAVFLGKDLPPRIEGCIMTGSRDQYYSYFIPMALATMIEERGGCGGHESAAGERVIGSAAADMAGVGALWQKVIGGIGSEGCGAVAATLDGGFLVTGYTFSRGTGDADMLVLKTDSRGGIQWYRLFGGRGTEYGFGCCVSDNGYLLTGYTTSYGEGSRDLLAVKVDLEGNEVWSGTYGGRGWDVGTAACEDGDGGYLLSGFTNSFGAGEEDIFIVRIDENGKEQWSRTYGGARFEYAGSICRLENGNFMIGGATGTFGGGNSDIYLVQIDPDGREIGAESIGGQLDSSLPEGAGTTFDWCCGAKTCSDGGFVAVGYTNAEDIMNMLVVRTDQRGELIWERNVGAGPFYDYGFSIVEIDGGDFLACGTTKSVGGNNDILIVRLDRDGAVISKRTLGGPDTDWGSALAVGRGGNVVIAGHTGAGRFGARDIYLAEIEP